MSIQSLSRRLNSPRKRIAAAAVLIVLVAAAVALRLGGRDNPLASEPLFTVEEGPLTISVIESGTIQSKEKVIVRSAAEGRNTILSIVPEGRMVQTGDLLIELDASAIVERQNDQQIRVENTQAAFTQAREKLEVVRNQAQADVEKAELDLKFARLNLEKYTEGEYPNQLRQAEADIAIANEELQRADDKLTWSRKLAESGYITRSELQGDELARKRSALNIELAQNKLDLLQKYTYVQEFEKRKSDVSQAEMALDRIRRRAASDVVQAEADLRAKESEDERQRIALDKLARQIEACRIAAPSNGMVVYATSVSSRRWNQEPLGVGQQVIERQDLIYLPADEGMMAEIRIHESALSKIVTGMPARVTVDALPGRTFYGTLGKIAVLPDANRSWMNPDLKVYACEIHFEGVNEGLRPGMNCQAEVIIAEYERAVYVPVQCVTRLDGQTVVYGMGRKGPEPRPVTVGFDNNRMIRIESGVMPGDQVLLAPPLPEQNATGSRFEAPGNGNGAPGTPPAPPTPGAAPKTPPSGRGARTADRSGRHGG